MLKLITTLTILLFGMLAQGQVTETRKIADFTKVIVKNATVVYTESDKSSLKIESEYNDASETIHTSVSNGTLTITGADAQNTTVYVSGKNVTEFKLRTKASVTVTNQLNAEAINLVLHSGATFCGNINTPNTMQLLAQKGTFFKGLISAGTLTGNFDSDAKVILSGTAKKAIINARNETVCNARNFVADNLLISAFGNATVTIYANKLIDLNVTDAAKIIYNGVPVRVTLNTGAIAFQKCKSDRIVTYNY